MFNFGTFLIGWWWHLKNRDFYIQAYGYIISKMIKFLIKHIIAVLDNPNSVI